RARTVARRAAPRASGAPPVARAAGGQTPGPSMPPAVFTALERTLDRTIECLTHPPSGAQSREARALLIEARRLRRIIANCRSIPPPSDVRDEMLERVVQLSKSVGAAFPEVMSEIAAAATQGPAPFDGEETEGYALDFEPALYSLEGANPKVQAAPRPAA